MIILGGNSGTAAEVETNTRALRTTLRPIDPGTLGSYSYGQSTGTMAAGLAAAAPIFSFRWSSGAAVAIVNRVRLNVAGTATAFTAGLASFELMAARVFTVADSAGAAATLTGNSFKRRTSFGTTLVGDIRASTTATLTAGTRTLDAGAAANLIVSIPTTASVTHVSNADMINYTMGDYPLTLSQNEGFIVRATVPATGTWIATVNVDWTEVATY